MLHADWSTAAFDLAPVAPRTGPFTRRRFLETWWRHRSRGDDRLIIAESGDGLAPLLIRDGALVFAGEADLTDYHAPLGPGAAAAVAEALLEADARRYRFDSLPEEAAAVVAKALAEVGASAEPEHHEVAAVLALPATIDGWLAELSKKERHELRRKQRRFAAEIGEPRLVRDGSAEAFAAFVAMHRSADGEKGRFMDDAMAAFFADLAAGGFVIDVLIAAGAPVAAAFGYEDDDGYFLYNSAYDPATAASSPGVVLLGELIAAQVERGAAIFDFMKGDEAYKFRLGAVARPLVVLEGTVP
jgi:CelD/BcsL family acetyltransferase involved in cellulose biosynthesis